MKWLVNVGILRRQLTEDATLGVAVQRGSDGRWYVIAIETNPSSTTIDEILASHAHQSLGDYRWLVQALWKADQYARSWSSGLEKCGCGPIEHEELL